MAQSSPAAEPLVKGDGTQSSVAGRIEAAPCDFADAVRSFAASMAARGKRPRSIARFTDKVKQCAAFNGWDRREQVTYEGAVEWLAAKRRDGWSPATYTQAVSILRRFGRHLSPTSNPLAGLEGDGTEGGEGSRAATTDELRAMIRLAYWRAGRDKRVKGNPGLFIGFLALTGLRANEAASATWGCLSSNKASSSSNEPSSPSSGPGSSSNTILWTSPKWSKNKRRQPIYLPAQLAVRLEAHRATVPNGPDCPIFPVVPNRHTWHGLREGAQLKARDERGRALTMHSARKWLASTLDEQGASPGLVSAVLRHSETLAEQRYVQKSEQSQVAAMQRLPCLFPDDGHGKNPQDPCTGEPMGYAVSAKEQPVVAHPNITNEPGLTGIPATAVSLAGTGDHVGMPTSPASLMEPAGRFQHGPTHFRSENEPRTLPGRQAEHRDNLEAAFLASHETLRAMLAARIGGGR